MPSTLWSRRAFAVRVAAVSSSLGFAGTAFGAAGQAAATAGLAGSDGLSHTSEAIHQEVVLSANRRRVYAALTDAEQFDKVTRLGAAREAATAPGAAPTAIGRDVGGAFSLFGGYVTGRHIELLADERLVQVWRAGSWKPGDYSIAKFALADEGSGTRLVFDHRGFPEGAGAHLAEGWHINYWQPLEKFLRSGGA